MSMRDDTDRQNEQDVEYYSKYLAKCRAKM